MNVQFTQTINGEGENFDDIGTGSMQKTATILESVREWLRKIRIQQEQAKNSRNRSIKAHQQKILSSLPLEEKHSLGLYHLIGCHRGLASLRALLFGSDYRGRQGRPGQKHK